MTSIALFSLCPGKRTRRNDDARSSHPHPHRLAIFGLFAPKLASHWSHRSPVAGAGSMRSSPASVTSAEQIAARDNCTVRQVNMTISLAFLAPDLVKAAVEGRCRGESALPACAMRLSSGHASTRCSV